MTDTTIVVKRGGKEDWEFSKDAALKPADGSELKVGDKVTVHYTMMAKSIEANKPVSKEHKPLPRTNRRKSPAASPAASPMAAPSASPAVH